MLIYFIFHLCSTKLINNLRFSKLCATFIHFYFRSILYFDRILKNDKVTEGKKNGSVIKSIDTIVSVFFVQYKLVMKSII